MTDRLIELLEKHFDLALEAPDGIQKLRELILTLGVRGKLVPQDPNDPPAAQLLTEIDAENRRLAKEGKPKASRFLPAISPEEIPFAVPNGWEWTRLGALSTRIDYGTSKKTSDDSSLVPVYRMGNIQSGILIDSNMKYIEPTIDDLPNLYLEDRDLLFNRTNSYELVGKTAQYRGRDNSKTFASYLIRVRLAKTHVSADFAAATMNSLYYRKTQVEPEITQQTGQANFNGTKLSLTLVPLPPLPEQRRIVAKIDQLMAVCDELEKKRDSLVQKRQAVHNAAIRLLLEAEEEAEFSSAWGFLIEHFGEVYSVRENVAELRKAISQLAVMGKLVKQDPNDLPARELLQELEAEKRRLVKEGKIKAPKLLPSIAPEDFPFAVPTGWEWVRLQQLLPDFQNGLAKREGPSGEFAIVLRLADVRENMILLESPREIRLTSTEMERYRLETNDILITRVNGSVDLVGSFVQVGILGVPLTYCDHFIRMRVFESWANPGYLHLVSKSHMIRKQIEEKFISTAGQKTVNQTHIGSLKLPLPPLPEQRRIVAKVDQLMALCDALERRLTASTIQKAALLDAVLAHG